jgi:hypothetical protein
MGETPTEKNLRGLQMKGTNTHMETDIF